MDRSAFKSTPSIIQRDFLSASLTGSGTRCIELKITHFIAVQSVILFPIETQTGLEAFLPFLSPAPHTFPLSPFNSAQSFYFLISSSQIFFTFYLPSPSIQNKVFPTPSVGISKRTPKWQAKPHLFWWRIPFPSIINSSGHNYGLFAFSFLNSSNRGGTYLKAKNPGTYGWLICMISQSSYQTFFYLMLKTTSPTHARSGSSLLALRSTPQINLIVSISQSCKSYSTIFCLILVCSAAHLYRIYYGITLCNYQNFDFFLGGSGSIKVLLDENI